MVSTISFINFGIFVGKAAKGDSVRHQTDNPQINKVKYQTTAAQLKHSRCHTHLTANEKVIRGVFSSGKERDVGMRLAHLCTSPNRGYLFILCLLQSCVNF